jgi:hypothetical protein
VVIVEAVERGHNNSRLRKFASTVAFRRAVVERHLADDFEGDLTRPGRPGIPRGAAWSNIKPGRGFGLKKQMLSDCDLRNLSKVDDGTGAWKADRIAAKEAIAIDSWFLQLFRDGGVAHELRWFLKLGRQNFEMKACHMTCAIIGVFR